MPAAADLNQRRARGRELQARYRADPDAAPGRMVVLSSFNVDLLPPLLIEALDRAGVPAEVAVGEFGQIAQEALNPGSELLSAPYDAALVIPAVADMLAQVPELVDERIEEVALAVDALLERSPAATCYVVAFGTHRVGNPHVLDPRSPERGQLAIERFLAGVRALAERSPRIVVVDWDWHARAAGLAETEDARLWYLGRMRLGPPGLAALSDLAAEHVAANTRAGRKVVAVDLDDTLWGGVVGEVGLSGLELGEEGVGLAYQDFQRELLALRNVGVLLVMCSKNNAADALEVFERHPGMVLRREHFAAERINWDNKADNLVAMADELDLGVDSFVFLDDNPAERELVRRMLPEVAVPELPEDPVRRPDFLRDVPLFRRVALTQADTQRARDYEARGSRQRLQAHSVSYEDYLRSLEQDIRIQAVDDASLARAAQLCQRTNQFNLTTRRHTPADIERMCASPDFELYTVGVSDRFSDSGITGLAIVSFDEGEVAVLDTLLLSCRVLGRGVEAAVLGFIAGRARARGARSLEGRYIPTPKNGQTADFYPRNGFVPIDEGVFRLDLAGSQLGREPEPQGAVVGYA